MKSLPQYCSKCGNKLLIIKVIDPKIDSFNMETGKPYYSQLKAKVSCPKKNLFNNHDKGWCIFYDPGWILWNERFSNCDGI